MQVENFRTVAQQRLLHHSDSGLGALLLLVKGFPVARRVVVAQQCADGDRIDERGAQLLGAAEAAEFQRQRGFARQVLVELLELRRQRDAQQPHDTPPRFAFGHVCRIEKPQVDTLAVVDQRRIAHQLAPAAPEFHLRGQVAEIPLGQPGALEFAVLGTAAIGDTRRAAQLLAQHGQIAPAGEFLSAVVDHAHVHFQMRRQFALPFIGVNIGAGFLADIGCQRLGQRPLTRLRHTQKRSHRVGQRNQRTALVLGQAFQQCGEFFPDQPGHQPVDLRGFDAVEQVQRQLERDAVERMARLEAVFQLACHAIDRHRLGKQRVVGTEPLAEDVLALKEQDFRVGGLGLGTPRLERRAIVETLRHACIEHAEDAFLVEPHAGLSRLVLEILDLLDQCAIVRKPRRARVIFARHQRAADEQFTRQFGVDGTVVDLAPRHQGDAVQTHAFECHHAGAVLFPVRFDGHARQQMTTRALDPFRAHFGDGAREQAAGVGQLGGHDPLWSFFCQRRARVDRQFDAARTLVVALARLGPRLGVIRLEADVTEQAGQQCLMDGIVAGVLVVLAQAQFAHLRMQLAMNVAPFAHPTRRQEMVLQQRLQLAVGFLVLHLLLVPAPQLEPAHEVGTLVGE